MPEEPEPCCPPEGGATRPKPCTHGKCDNDDTDHDDEAQDDEGDHSDHVETHNAVQIAPQVGMCGPTLDLPIHQT